MTQGDIRDAPVGMLRFHFVRGLILVMGPVFRKLQLRVGPTGRIDKTRANNNQSSVWMIIVSDLTPRLG